MEEILGYLKSCFSREPTMATVCVQQVSNLCLCVSLCITFCFVRFICVCVCGSLKGFSTEQCAATGATPHRVRLVPADRACKGIGLPVRWSHTSLYTPSLIYLHVPKQRMMPSSALCNGEYDLHWINFNTETPPGNKLVAFCFSERLALSCWKSKVSYKTTYKTIQKIL